MKLRTLKPGIGALGNRLATVQPDSWRTDKQGSAQRGYNYRWQQYRIGYLAKHPLCQCPRCDEGRIRVRVANVVDHKVAHRGDPTLFWDPSNHQAMNDVCHNEKTEREERGGSEVGAGQKVGRPAR